MKIVYNIIIFSILFVISLIPPLIVMIITKGDIIVMFMSGFFGAGVTRIILNNRIKKLIYQIILDGDDL